jgi:uncharacterized protein YigA (DUF484 family)
MNLLERERERARERERERERERHPLTKATVKANDKTSLRFMRV